MMIFGAFRPTNQTGNSSRPAFPRMNLQTFFATGRCLARFHDCQEGSQPTFAMNVCNGGCKRSTGANCRMSPLGRPCRTAQTLIFQSLLRLLRRLQVQRQDIALYYPSWCDPAEAERHAGCPSSYKPGLPLCVSLNECRKR
jgi:hypothetical protein